ncbi:MAG: hypothetical protein KJ579_04060 [Verrucomicrobia bacterium]|nr:hypothetical protein [Verrucomicrobiota bacterium]
MPEARKGKIARLPLSIRLELNRRMRDGQKYPTLCRWLNGLPEAEGALSRDFAQWAVTPQNLSEWRAGGYADWLKDEGRVENVRRLSDYAFSLAKAAGGTLGEGAAAIAGGKILEALEAADGEDVLKLTAALASLRGADASVISAKAAHGRLAQKDRELALAEQKFQRQTAELFLKWFDNEAARRIAEGREAKPVKMEKIIGLMFGERPAPAAAQ